MPGWPLPIDPCRRPLQGLDPHERYLWPPSRTPGAKVTAFGGGRFELHGIRHTGGQASIWLARDHQAGCDVVVKTLRPDRSDQVAARRIIREGRLLERLGTRRGMVGFVARGEGRLDVTRRDDSDSGAESDVDATAAPATATATVDDGLFPWIALPLHEHQVLGEALAPHDGTLPADAVRGLAVDLAAALAVLDSQGVVHRDLSPGNVLLTAEGLAITDFGVAWARFYPDDVAGSDDVMSTGLTRVLGRPLTDGWYAPEMVYGVRRPNRPDRHPLGDVYCWGLYLHAAVTGRHPWAARGLYPTDLEERGRLLDPDEVDLHDFDRLAPDLTNLVRRVLRRDPAARPTAADLLSLLTGSAQTPVRGGVPASDPVPRRIGVAEPRPDEEAPSGSPGEDAARIADQLARRVSDDWRPEYQRRVGDTTGVLQVTWRSAPDELAVPLRSLDGPAGRYAQQFAGVPHPTHARLSVGSPDPLAGQGPDLAGLFVHRVHSRRLVVLGSSGSGKSVLMVRLLLELLDGRTPAGPVPLLIPAAGWDPNDQDLWQWVRAKACEADAWLAESPVERGVSRFEALRREGLLVVVLDGLDELSPPAIQQALRRIEEDVHAREAIVVSCQTPAYRALMSSADARLLARAPGVEIAELAVDQAFDHLESRCANDDRSQWQAVRETAKEASALQRVFSTVLMVSLADRIYNPGVGSSSGARPRPERLLELRDDEAGLRAQLVEGFLPAAYRTRPRGRPGVIPAPARERSPEIARVRRWLAGMASVTRTPEGTPRAFAWWELADAAPAWLVPAVVALLGGIPAGVAGALNPESGVGLGVGLIVALAVGLAVRRVLRAVDADARWSRPSPLSLGLGLVAGLVGGLLGASFREAGLFGGVAGGIAMGFGIGALTGPGPGVVGGLAGGLAGELLAGHGTPLATGVLTTVGAAATLGMVAAEIGRRTPARGGAWTGRGVVRGLVVGAALSLAIGLGAWREFGALGAVGAAMVAFVALGLLSGLVAEPAEITDAATSSIEDLLRADRLTFVLFAIVGALSGFLAFFVGVTARIAVAGGLAGALGLAFFQAAWGRFAVARIYFAARRRLPWDLMAFLRDAHSRDVLRRVGVRYDFRHSELRQYVEGEARRLS